MEEKATIAAVISPPVKEDTLDVDKENTGENPSAVVENVNKKDGDEDEDKDEDEDEEDDEDVEGEEDEDEDEDEDKDEHEDEQDDKAQPPLPPGGLARSEGGSVDDRKLDST